MKKYPRVLAIAGSDSGGCAGIQADIKAISATGSYACCAITAVTVQNTMGVRAIHPVPDDIIRGQIDAVLDDIGADAVKIGMLGSSRQVMAVKESLVRHNVTNIVFDPVMVATSGDRLLDEDAVDSLTIELAPYVRVLTPNVDEARIISGEKINSQEDLPHVGKLISSRLSSISGRPVSVLMKAGHLEGDEIVDCFFNAEENRIVELRSRRFYTRNTHGTGCTLSSAFASYLAQGLCLDEAARCAGKYMSRSIEAGAGYELGSGHGPVDHFFILHR